MKVEINLIVLHCIFILSLSLIIIHTSRVPVEGESSVCLKKYRIIILIIIIMSLGQILLSYIVNTSRTHAHIHARTHAHIHAHACTHSPPFRLLLFHGAPNREGPFALATMAVGASFNLIDTRESDPISPEVLYVLLVYKIARTRTHDRMCYQ